MRKTQASLAAILVLGGMAAPAFADVTALATISKTDTISVTETISITKHADVFVTMGVLTPDGNGGFIISPLTLPGAAEANTLANVTNTNNTTGPNILAGPFVGTPVPDSDTYRATLSGSISNNQGIVQTNQDSGNNSNQGNNVALAFTQVQNSFADAEAGGSQVNTGNKASEFPIFPGPDVSPGVDPSTLPITIFDTSAVISGSIIGNTGIVSVNQNSGDMNNQTNEIAAAVGVNPQLALAEGALGQVNSGNYVTAVNSVKTDQITDSINGNTGIVNVNQSVGNMNNQMSSFAIAAAVDSNVTLRNIVGAPTTP